MDRDKREWFAKELWYIINDYASPWIYPEYFSNVTEHKDKQRKKITKILKTFEAYEDG